MAGSRTIARRFVAASATLTALVSLALCAVEIPAFAGAAGTVQGIVTTRGAGQDGVSVEVYLDRKSGVAGAPFAVTESGGGGRFTIELPAGVYYLWAKGKPPAFGPPAVTEFAANPVAVTAGKTTVLPPLELKEAGREALPAPPKETGLKGRVTMAGKPAADVSVVIYDAGAARLIGPGYLASIVTGLDGAFQVDLPPGKYRVAARKRKDGAAAGFLRVGDLSGEYAGNPLSVALGKYSDLGELRLHPVDERRLAEQERSRREGASPTRLVGNAVTPKGKPLPGQYVFVYRDQGMIGRPEQMATTGADGSFSFDLPGGGTWYLGARSTMGGPRQPGELVGRLSGSVDSSVTIQQGMTKSGLAITMEVAW